MTSKSSKNIAGKPYLSLIIPAYKAEKYVKKNLLTIKKELDKLGDEYELICVVDGRVDRTTREASEVSKKHKNIRVVGYLSNLGKGHAVRYGMAKARGEVIGFIDDGLEINPKAIPILLEHFKWYGADVIVGSKRHPASKVRYYWQRRILSFGYQLLVRLLFGLKVRDTQVGLKLFRRELLEKVLPRLLVKEFAFDIELLAVAHYLGFRRIYDGPVEIKIKFSGSTVVEKGFVRIAVKMLWDTAAVFYRLRILRFYDYKNRKNWIASEYLTIKNEK